MCEYEDDYEHVHVHYTSYDLQHNVTQTSPNDFLFCLVTR